MAKFSIKLFNHGEKNPKGNRQWANEKTGFGGPMARKKRVKNCTKKS